MGIGDWGLVIRMEKKQEKFEIERKKETVKNYCEAYIEDLQTIISEILTNVKKSLSRK